MKRSTTLTAIAVCASAAVGISALAATPANADPSPATPYRVLVGSGSDTTQDVLNGFAANIVADQQVTTATGATTNGSATVTLAAANALIKKGQVVTGTGIPADTTVAAISGTTLTLSATATADGATVALAFLNGYWQTGRTYSATAIGGTTLQTSLAGLTVGQSIVVGLGTVNEETVTIASVGGPASAYVTATSTPAVPYNTYTVSAFTKVHAANEVVRGARVAAGTKVLASYDSQGGAYQSRGNANCQFIANNAAGATYSGTTQAGVAGSGTNANYLLGGRQFGSGLGYSALRDSYQTSTSGNANALWGCMDFARASSARSGTSGGAGAVFGSNTVNIPFAQDALAFAVALQSNFTRLISWQDLKDIYRCTYTGMIPANTVFPAGKNAYSYAAENGLLYAQIPQSGSGTRDFIVRALGLADTAADRLAKESGKTGAACITDKNPNGTSLEEHNLATLTQDGIGVTSIAQSITQRAQAVAGVNDQQGFTTLVAIDNTANGNGNITAKNNGRINYPTQMTSNFGGGSGTTSGALVMWREVFNTVPASALNDPNVNSAFVGSSSALCLDADGVAAKYGFILSANCGSTTFSNVP